MLTGGGSLPSRIADRIVIGLEQMRYPLLKAHRNLKANEIPVETLDDHLVRGASAVGGTSVLLAPEQPGNTASEDLTKGDLLQKVFSTNSQI